MINILFISHFSHFQMGGQQSMSNLIENLDTSKYKVYAVMPEAGVLSQRLEKASCQCFFIPFCALKPKYYLRQLKNILLLRDIIKTKDIHIIHADHERDAFIATWAVMGTKCKIVWHLRLTRKNNLDNFISKKSNAIIGISEGTRLRIPQKEQYKFKVIFNGVDCDVFTPIPDRKILRNELNLPLDSFIIIFVGQIKKGKGVLDLIEMAKHLVQNKKQFQLLVIGKEVAEDFSEVVKEHIKENNLYDYVNLIGHKNNVHQYMQAADVLILPSHENVEGMGRVLFEAMACGTTVIGSDLPGINEVITEETGFLVKPHFPKDISEKILFLIDNPKTHISYNVNARNRAKNLFDIKIHAYKISELYDSLL